MCFLNLEINMNSVPSAAVNLVPGQLINKLVISNPVPQTPVQAKPGISRSDVLPGKGLGLFYGLSIVRYTVS